MASIEFGIPKQVGNALHRPRRDLAITAEDDITLEVTVYPTDADTDPYDVSDSTSEFVVYDHAGNAALTVAGDIVDAGAGRIDVVIDGDDTADLSGRYSYRLTVEFPDGSSTVMTGAAHIFSRDGVTAISGVGSGVESDTTDLDNVTIIEADIATATIGDLTVSGTFDASGAGSFDGALTVGGALSVTGNVTAAADLSVGDDLTVTGNVTAAADLSVGDDLTVTGDASVTGNVTITGATTAEAVALSAWRLQDTYQPQGAYDPDTAPISVRLQLTRDDTATHPTGIREITSWRIQSDKVKSLSTTGANATVRHWGFISTLGANGTAAADSWAGPRVMMHLSHSDRSPPVEAVDAGDLGRSLPSTNNLWLSSRWTQNRGGTGLSRLTCRGSNFNFYSIITLDGASMMNVTRQMELGFVMESDGSTRVYRGIALPIIRIDGPIPPGPFTGVELRRTRPSVPGYVSGFLAGGRSAGGGIDPFLGIAFEHSASSADVGPRALAGLSMREVSYRRNAIEWAGGDISGGTIGANGTGRLRLGTAFFEQTSSGLSIDVCGYEGGTAGSVVNMSAGTTVIYPELGTFLEDEHDGFGVYRARSRGTDKINSVQVVVPPVSKTNPGSTKTTVKIKPHTQATPTYVFNVTGTATTTVHPAPVLNTDDDFCVGMYLEYMSGVCAGESQIITAYNGTTGAITTAAFSTVPTLTNDAITNGNFTTNPLTGAEGVVTSGWSWFTDGAAAQPTWTSSQVSIVGTGTDAAGIDQQVTVTALVDYVLGFTFKGPNGFTVKLGTTQGAADIHEAAIEGEPSEDDDSTTVNTATVRFSIPSGSSVWLRIQNAETGEAIIDRVTCQAYTDIDTVFGVRAKIVSPTLNLAHSWTQKNTLALQGSGGPATFGGTLGVTGDFAVATSKFTVASATGNTVVAGTLGVTGASTLAALSATTGAFSGDLSVATSKFTVASATGNTVVAGTLGVTGATTSTGNLTVGASKMTVTASTGDTAIAGTLGVTGTATMAAITASGAVSLTAAGTALAVTNNATIGGTLGITGATSASTITATGAVSGASMVVTGSTVPANGVYLPAASTVGLAAGSALSAQVTATALSPGSDDGQALGTTALRWSDLFLASGAVVNFANGDATITHGTGTISVGVTAASFSGTLTSTGNFTVGSSKLTVTASSGNTSVGGTLGVTGAATLSSTLAVTGASTLTGALTVNNTITANQSGGSLTALGGTVIYAAAADATATRVTIDAAATNPYVQFRRYDGTYASPSALASGVSAGTIGWRGYTGAAMSGERAYIEAVTAEAWSGSAQGAHIDFGTTAAGATSNATRKMRLTSAGQLLIGTTTASAELTVTGNASVSGYALWSVNNALTATGTTRTDALQLAKQINRLTTVAASTGAILPTGVIGMDIVIFNSGANALKVYANGSETIDGTAGSTGVTLSAGARCRYMFLASNTWISALMGAVSA